MSDNAHGLIVSRLSKSYAKQAVFSSLDLRLTEGALRIAGVNGSGKSTLLALIAGALTADSGDISLDGLSISHAPQAYRRCLAYSPSDHAPFEFMTVTAYCQWVMAMRGCASPAAFHQELCAGFGLDAEHMAQPLSQLSLGFRHKAGLLAELICDKRLLLLDEPTNGLDAKSVDTLCTVMSRLAQSGTLILFASHDEAFAGRIATSSHVLDHA